MNSKKFISSSFNGRALAYAVSEENVNTLYSCGDTLLCIPTRLQQNTLLGFNFERTNRGTVVTL
jgi:hypothetical protein